MQFVARCLLMFVTVAAVVALPAFAEVPRPATMSKVLVVTANAKEDRATTWGALDVPAADDREQFVDRLLRKAPAAPDIVLLQEVLGSADEITRLLNTHPRIEGSGNRYAVAVPPRLWRGGEHCDGHRNHQRRIWRDVAIVVNTARISGPVDTGKVRTWGAYTFPRASHDAYEDCKEHVWALLRVETGSNNRRLVRVMNVHPAPAGRDLKTAAMRKIADRMVRLQRRTPHALAVIGGDYNLSRCQSHPERRHCRIREAHRHLEHYGYLDAIRATNPTGPTGVTGVKYRIDHIYTDGTVIDSWFDRCYRAFNVTSPACPEKKAVFAEKRIYLECHRLANRGKGPASPCDGDSYGRYYSDHPMMWATLTWRTH